MTIVFWLIIILILFILFALLGSCGLFKAIGNLFYNVGNEIIENNKEKGEENGK